MNSTVWKRWRKMSLKRENNYEGDSPLLYLVATPIGNKEEFTPRAINVLKEMDYIACEDTRNSGLLFSKFDIKKHLISCREFNENEKAEEIISLLKEGKKVAYVSDAGYPGISDPGQKLVSKALEADIKVAIINGPNAGLCALLASGLDTTHFTFEGFLPSKDSLAKKRLEELKNWPHTLIFYEAPHRIERTLTMMKDAFGGDRKVCLARELTKLHEEYIRGTFSELLNEDPETLRGEMVICVEGKEITNEISDDDIEENLKEALKSLSSKEAVKKVATDLKVGKNKVYNIYLERLK